MIFLLKSVLQGIHEIFILSSVYNVAPSLPSENRPHLMVTGQTDQTGGIHHLYTQVFETNFENSTITSIFLQFEDNTYELMDKKFYNAKKLPPSITNGISELILTADGEKFKVVFIDKLKPKKQTYKEINLPDDL